MLQAELADLERLGGRPPVLNQELFERANVRQYLVPYTDASGAVHDLSVTYSDQHPYFRVEVATNSRLTTHQQPFMGQLCLLRGGTAHWDVTETAAQMIEQQMPLLLLDQQALDHDPATTVSDGRAVHAEQAHVEPYAGYYTYKPEAVVRLDGSWPDLLETDAGSFTLGLDSPDIDIVRGSVLQILATDGTVLRNAESTIREMFALEVTGRWCRLAERPIDDTPEGVLAVAIAAEPTLAAARFEMVGGGKLDLCAVVFADDIRADIETGEILRGDAWIVVVRSKERSPKAGGTKGRGGGRRVTPKAEVRDPYLVRAQRAGRRDMTLRVPTLSPLSSKKVALFGAGGTGAPSSIELAKAGVGTLSLVEPEFLDTGNAARWPLGYMSAGLHKLSALRNLIRAQWPYTQLELFGVPVGIARSNDEIEPQWKILDEVLDGADLVYDATAEIGVNYYLSELAKDRGIPYIIVSATEGGWGGMVARFWPDADRSCWTCLMHHLDDGTLPLPPSDPDPATRSIWPAGCTDPTFTGTGFDIAAVANTGVRLAVATLCAEVLGAYPPADWDYATLAFRNDTAALAGNATTFSIEPHQNCAPCRIRKSG